MMDIFSSAIRGGKMTASASAISRFLPWARRTGIAACALTLGAAFTPPSQQAFAQSAPWRVLSPGQLTAVFWQWLYKVPWPDNAIIDTTGVDAYNGQPYKDLVFLGGTYALEQLATGDVLGKVTRTINLKSSAALFFPVINAESDNLGCRPRISVPSAPCVFTKSSGAAQIAKAVTASMDGASDLYATWTPADESFNATGPATNIAITRLKSPPFPYKLPAQNNIYQYIGVDVSGTIAPAVGDGYFSFVPGGTFTGGQNYVLRFGGKLPITATNFFILDITYQITVTP